MNTSILLVDDEANVLAALKRSLLDEPYDVESAGSGEEAGALMSKSPFKLVISDERMPGMDGAEFLGIVKSRWPETVRIMLTGHASVDATMQAVNKGEIYRFFTKPWDDVMLKLAIRSAIEKFDLEDENRKLLKTVKRQSQELKALETRYPGISEVKRDERGFMELPEITDDEMQSIISTYNKW
jgi:DNA-binding NtrC family response regulator